MSHCLIIYVLRNPIMKSNYNKSVSLPVTNGIKARKMQLSFIMDDMVRLLSTSQHVIRLDGWIESFYIPEYDIYVTHALIDL